MSDKSNAPVSGLNHLDGARDNEDDHENANF